MRVSGAYTVPRGTSSCPGDGGAASAAGQGLRPERACVTSAASNRSAELTVSAARKAAVGAQHSVPSLVEIGRLGSWGDGRAWGPHHAWRHRGCPARPMRHVIEERRRSDRRIDRATCSGRRDDRSGASLPQVGGAAPAGDAISRRGCSVRARKGAPLDRVVERGLDLAVVTLAGPAFHVERPRVASALRRTSRARPT